MTIAVPLHVQLRDALVEQIISGALPVGLRIPSERELCRSYNVSRTTTRRTLSQLMHEGWIYTVVGKGTYVAPNRLEQELKPITGFADDLRRRGISVMSHVVTAGNVKASDEVAAYLDLTPGAPLVELERVRVATGTPLVLQVAFLPEHLCPDLLRFDFATRSLYDVLRTEYGLPLRRGETVIKADLATGRECGLLDGEDPMPVLRTFQTTYLDDDRPIEYCQSVFRGDLYELRTTTGT
jgi:GntR family transcriptional regulator